MTVAAPPTVLDVLYPVRPGDGNEELRFSLRSLDTHYPHGVVWVAGYKPCWVTGVQFLPGNNQPHPRANLYWNLLDFCRHPDTPEVFVVMNDDFYVTEPVKEIPVLYRGTLADHIALVSGRRRGGWWLESLQTTMICLQANGMHDPLSYELHVPFVVNKHLMAETLERFAPITPQNPPQWRTLYGVMNNIGGEQAETDCKAYRPGEVSHPFHSTDDNSWRHFAPHFRTTFPEPCQYEVQ